MAESILSELVMNLLRMVGSLHEKNLKYEAQVTGLSKELARARSAKVDLEAQILAYQNGNSIDSKSTNSGVGDTIGDQQQQAPQVQQQPQLMSQHHQQETQHPQPSQQNQTQQQPCLLIQPQQVPLHHHNHQQHQQQHHPQVVYQPIAPSQSFITQPQYIWSSYDPTTSGVVSTGQVPAYYEQYSGSAQAFAQHTLSNNSEI